MARQHLSTHVQTVYHLLSVGELKQAEAVISEISYSDYLSRYLCWARTAQMAAILEDIPLARKAGNQADYYARLLD